MAPGFLRFHLIKQERRLPCDFIAQEHRVAVPRAKVKRVRPYRARRRQSER